MNNTVFIPTNYTDAGRLLGMFEIRNTAEAIILCIPVILFVMFCLPFGMTFQIITASVLVIPLGGFSLFGIGDHSLFEFLMLWLRYRRRRKIYTYRGSICQKKNPK